MNRSISTISRKIKRNTDKRDSHYKQARKFANTRHKNKAIKMRETIKKYITQKLQQYRSSEQIVARLPKFQITIYLPVPY